MSKSLTAVLTLSLALSVFVSSSLAQPFRPPGEGRGRGGERSGDKDDEPKPPPLPEDPRLLALHRQFVEQAAKLAGEYEQKKDWEKAKGVYEEVLKLLPENPQVKAKLAAVNDKLATANRKVMDVDANDAWQNSGVTVLAGKPITIRATGKWTFTLTAELGPEGMSIPKEIRDFNLGCLVAVIDTGNPKDYEPFVVGAEKSFVPKITGRLYLRMYDIDPKDNKGKLDVEILGTYEQR